MAVSKGKKIEQLALLEQHLKEAKSVGFTSNQKITVSEVFALKKELRTAQALFLVAKKTLIRIAFKNVYNIDLDIDTLPGQVAMIIAKDDALAPLGIANKFVNEWRKEQKMVFVGGYMEGKMMDAEETKKLATLPSREVLLSKMLGSLMSPLSALVRFFDGAKEELTTKNLSTVADLTQAIEAPVEAPKPVEEAVEEKSEEKVVSAE